MDALRELASILAPTPFSDLGGYWLQTALPWIPADEGKGTCRFEWRFYNCPGLSSGHPHGLYLRRATHSPVALLANWIPLGGEQGLAYQYRR